MSDFRLAAAGPAANGHTSSPVRRQPVPPEEAAAGWECRKRDDSVVPFDLSKVRRALFRCFHSVGLAATLPGGPAEEEEVVSRVVRLVVNSLRGTREAVHPVETIQRHVLQHLWGEELFEAAEHYQNYRETHRRRRAAAAVPAEVADRVRADQKHFPHDLQYYQLMSKFSRWREADRRRETWREVTYDRVVPWLQRVPQAAGKLSVGEWQELADAMFRLEASPAMRVVQMAGPALDRCHIGAYNCAYMPLEDVGGFAELLYVLMQGTGVGFSAETDYVSELPRVKKQKGKAPDVLVVEDDTESWCDVYREGLQRLWDGHDFHADVSRVRPKGARLKTKGGRASGPGPLLDLFAFSRNLVKSRQGRYLEDTDVHRLGCFTGKIVQVGGVRRAAEISLSDLDSVGMRTIKSGTWWDAGAGLWPDAKYLSMANNSAVYGADTPVEVFMEEWLALVKGKSGERGIFNRAAAQKYRPKRRKAARFGVNPCGEIVLRPYGLCNLSMAIARPGDTAADLRRKVRLAAVFGKLQSLCTDFRYVRPEWKKNADEERLLGVDITGQADCDLLKPGAPGRAALLRELAKVVEDTDVELSARFGVGRSAANTTVKPGGDSAVLFHCGSGVSPWFARHSVRWVREPKDSPVARFLVASGVPHADAPEAPAELMVFGFPREAPAGSLVRDDVPARDQFFNWLEWKDNWAEHSVSATIYVEPHEWPELGALVYQHLDKITGLSFLPKDNGSYTYAPNEEVTEERFREMSAAFPDLNWAKLPEYEAEDGTTGSQTFACVGGGCE